MTESRSHIPVLLLVLAVMLSGCGNDEPQVTESAVCLSVDSDASPRQDPAVLHRHHNELHYCVRVDNIDEPVTISAAWMSERPITGRTALDTSRIRIGAEGWVDFTLLLGADGLPYGTYLARCLLDTRVLDERSFVIEPMFVGAIAEAVLAAELTPSALPERIDSVFVQGAPVHLAIYARERCSLTITCTASASGTRESAEFEISADAWNEIDLEQTFDLPPDSYSLQCSTPEQMLPVLRFSVTERRLPLP